MSDDSARSVVAPGRRKRRWVRALALGAAALLVVLVVAVGAVAWVLTHLDHPAVKARWVEAVRNATGLEIDVDSASISLSGRVTLAGLRVAQPPRQRPFAPDFAVVEAFEATADVPALLTGRIRIDPIAIRGVSVTVVVDASGRTSLDDVLAGLAPTRPAPLPPTPRSRMMEVEGLDLVVSSFTVRDVHFAQIVTRNAAIATIRTLQGLDLDAAVRIAGGRLDATMTLASPADGTLLDVRPSNTGDAEASQSGARAGLRMSASVKESGSPPDAGGRPAGPVVRHPAAEGGPWAAGRGVGHLRPGGRRDPAAPGPPGRGRRRPGRIGTCNPPGRPA